MAFGGAYLWTIIPLALGAAALAGIARPSVLVRETRLLDAALILCVAFAAAQLVPLPQPTRLAIAPALADVDRALYLDAGNTAARPAAPLTIDREGTIQSVVIAITTLLIFWSARSLFAGGTLRRTIRVVAVLGLAASALAIAQHATAPLLLYWLWRPSSRNASPYTPFINKNDLAAWLILAIPLTLGYIIARVDARRREGVPSPIEAALDDTAAWLVGGLTAMTAALLVTVSRAGLIGGAASIVAFLWLSRDRMPRRGRLLLIGGLTVVVVIGLLYVNSGALLTRVDETIANGIGGRREIWAATLVMIRDFPMTGIGAGAYERAMTVYQPPHVFSFNHAHSEYLQIVAEGGAVLAALVAAALAAGILQAAARLSADRTPVFWIRAGAISSACAIAVQSVWETGLRMPANAVLFAICCAAALHAPHPSAAEPGRRAARDPVRVGQG